MTMTTKSLLCTSVAALLSLSSAKAGLINFTGSYAQDFNGLASSPNSTNVALSGGIFSASQLDGWYYNDTVYSHYHIDSGLDNQTNLYSYGAINSTERALGVKHNGNADDVAFGVRLVNNTGSTITALNIGFTGEQWHAENHTDPLHFEYKVGGASLLETGYTNYTNLNFTSPQTGGGALDGNAVANQTALADTITGLNWTAGQEMWIRWSLPATGTTPGLAIDNLTIEAVPEPATFSVGAALLAVGAFRRRRSAR
jgi:hypothetical protein